MFIPVIIVILFAIALAPISPKGRGGRKNSKRGWGRKTSKRRQGVTCGPGGVSTRGKKFRMT